MQFKIFFFLFHIFFTQILFFAIKSCFKTILVKSKLNFETTLKYPKRNKSSF